MYVDIFAMTFHLPSGEGNANRLY